MKKNKKFLHDKARAARYLIYCAIKWAKRPLNSNRGWKNLYSAGMLFWNDFQSPNGIKLTKLGLSPEEKKIVRIGIKFAIMSWGDYEEKLEIAVHNYLKSVKNLKFTALLTAR